MAQGSGVGTKDILVALPVLGAALAVTYDVGYFWGLNINFFSAFSLQEHIAFALEYIPFALAISSIAFILPILAQWAWKEGQVTAQRDVRSGRRTPFYKVRINWLLFACCFYDVFWCWYSQSATSFVGLSFFVAALIVTAFRVTLAHILSLFFLAASFAFAVAFSLGFNSANSYRKSEKYSQTVTPLQGAPIKAKIVRSGDKGLLFFDESTKALVLLPWDQIKEISSAP